MKREFKAGDIVQAKLNPTTKHKINCVKDGVISYGPHFAGPHIFEMVYELDPITLINDKFNKDLEELLGN